MKRERVPLPPCPMCGRHEGGFMVDSRWGHDFPCCSEACGLAFKDAPTRWERELRRAEEARVFAEERCNFCRAQLARTRGK